MADTWEEYEWPLWVPDEVKKSIMDFWGPSQSRTPKDWLENWKDRTDIAMGQEVVLQELCGKRYAQGKYIHAWNNIGRVVDRALKVHYVACPPVYKEYKKQIRRACTLCGQRVLDKAYVVEGKFRVHLICYLEFTLNQYEDLLEDRKAKVKKLERKMRRKQRKEAKCQNGPSA